MPRLFTGLEIPPDVGQSLSFIRGGLSGARWIEPENYHLTLRFIGDVDGGTAREVAFALEGVRRPPLEVHIDHLHAFGGNKPRALVAGIKPNPALTELQAEHERLLQRLGLPAEGRKFSPHVTLARLRDTKSRDVADFLAARGLWQIRPFTAERFVLFSARASTGGGPYVAEATYALDGGFS